MTSSKNRPVGLLSEIENRTKRCLGFINISSDACIENTLVCYLLIVKYQMNIVGQFNKKHQIKGKINFSGGST